MDLGQQSNERRIKIFHSINYHSTENYNYFLIGT